MQNVLVKIFFFSSRRRHTRYWCDWSSDVCSSDLWAGGTLAGIRSKLGYLQRLGVTALWISPVLRQRPGTSDYHGYGTQDFLQVDPHYGTDEDLRDLVADAHALGLYVVLDVVLNHTGDVFGYDADRYPEVDRDTGRPYMDPRWDGRPYRVAGWRDATGAASLPFPDPVDPAAGDSAVWPAELQADGTFTCRGRISSWDHDPEYLDRKSTRLNSSHANISYAVFCLKKKKTRNYHQHHL